MAVLKQTVQNRHVVVWGEGQVREGGVWAECDCFVCLSVL